MFYEGVETPEGWKLFCRTDRTEFLAKCETLGQCAESALFNYQKRFSRIVKGQTIWQEDRPSFEFRSRLLERGGFGR